MAKSIRSKSKRKNRTEFRNTIGAEAAKRNMEIIQNKLQQCINNGQINSFDRLSKIFGGSSSDDLERLNVRESSDVEMITSTSEKKKSTTPIKKANSRKHSMSKMIGQYGDKTSRKMREKKKR